MLAHHRGDVGVVVLHRADRPARGVLARPGGGAVARVRVGDQQPGSDAGQLLEVPLGGGRAPPGWRGRRGRRCAGSARRSGRRRARRCSSGRRPTASTGVDLERQGHRQRGVAAGAAHGQLGAADDPGDRVVARHVDRAGRGAATRRRGRRAGRRASSSSVTIGSPDEVAGGHHQHRRVRAPRAAGRAAACRAASRPRSGLPGATEAATASGRRPGCRGSSTIGCRGPASSRRTSSSRSTRAAATSRSRAITANGLSPRCLRRRSSATALSSRASQARW